MSRQVWLRRRLARVLGPAAVYVGLVSAIVLVLQVCGVAGSALEYGGWVVAMHLWFLAVYLPVVLLTPIAVAAHRRWGLLVPAVLAVAVAVVDAAAVGGGVPYLRWLNYLLCWGALYQLGIGWHGGLLAGRRPVLLAAGSAVALALLLWLGPYPIGMITVPGQAVQNSFPPTMAMLAFGCAQAGLAMAVAPALNRALRPGLVQRVLSTANSNVIVLYLWHLMPVVIVVIVGYPSGLLPQPTELTARLLARLEWVVVLGIATALMMALFWWQRRFFAGPLPMIGMPLTQRWAGPIMLAGAAMAAYGLRFFSFGGFAPAGRFGWVTGLVFAAGVVLVAFRPAVVNDDRSSGDALRVE